MTKRVVASLLVAVILLTAAPAKAVWWVPALAGLTALAASITAWAKITNATSGRDPLPCLQPAQFGAPITTQEEKDNLVTVMGPEEMHAKNFDEQDPRIALTWKQPYVASQTGGQALVLFHRMTTFNPSEDFPKKVPNGVRVGDGNLFGQRPLPFLPNLAYTEIKLENQEIVYKVSVGGKEVRSNVITGLDGNRSRHAFNLSALYGGDKGRAEIEALRKAKTPIKLTFSVNTIWRASRYLNFPDAPSCSWKPYTLNDYRVNEARIGGPAVTITLVGDDVAFDDDTIYEPRITAATPSVEGKTAKVALAWTAPSQAPNGTPKYQIYRARVEEKSALPELSGATIQKGTYEEAEKGGNYPSLSADLVAFNNLALAPGGEQRLGLAVKANFALGNNRDIGYSNVKEVVFTRTDDGSGGDAGATYEATEGRELERPTDRAIRQPGEGGLTEGTGLSGNCGQDESTLTTITKVVTGENQLVDLLLKPLANFVCVLQEVSYTFAVELVELMDPQLKEQIDEGGSDAE